jgi:hypothetical protein
MADETESFGLIPFSRGEDIMGIERRKTEY